MQSLAQLKEVWKREEVRSISRRYFVSNGFDGTLTSIGIAVGSYLSGISSGITVFQVGVGAAIGLATSGVWSVWEIEKAEKLAEIHEEEKSMLRDLEGSELHKRKMQGRLINAVMSGLGPVIGIILPLIPFLFEPSITAFGATLASIAIGVALLFSFGSYMGMISKQKWYIAGLRMGLAGLVVAAINFVLPG